MTTPEPRRSKHLLDLDNPPPRATAKTERSLTRVQQWVMSILAVSTVAHLAGGLIVAALYLDDIREGAAEGLMVIAGIMMVLGIVLGRLIHRAHPLSWWLVLGVLPTLIGLWLLHR